jgi:hypothetical protein
MKKFIFNSHKIFITIFIAIFFSSAPFALPGEELPKKYPVTLDSDNLFYIYSGIGVLSAEKRAEEITAKLHMLVKNDSLNYDSIVISQQNDYLILKLADEPIMAITGADAQFSETTESALAEMYREIIAQKLKTTREKYSQKSRANNGLDILLVLSIMIIIYLVSVKIFSWLNKKIDIRFNKNSDISNKRQGDN